MPLDPDATEKIRACLEGIARGERPPRIVIGRLTETQTTAINIRRANHKPPLPLITGVVNLVGRHLYERRVLDQGYSIEEVLIQVASALAPESELIDTQRGTLIQNKKGRIDAQGCSVRDVAVLECSGSRTGESQLYSAYPEGDGKGGD